MTFRRILWGLVALAAIAAAAGYLNRDAIRMAIFTRGVERSVSRDVLKSLDPGALHVAFCGTGSPLPNREHGEACTMVIAGGRLFLFDAGEGAARTLGAMALPPGRLEGVWLTHIHSDHFNGLGNLGLQRWAGASAATPLAVFGPPGVDQLTQGLNTAYRRDGDFRIAHHGPEVVPPSGFGLNGRAVAPGVIYDRDGVRITAFLVDHRPVVPAYGFRIEWRGRSVTLTGDTAAFPGLAKAAAGTDLLVSEALSPRMVGILGAAMDRHGQPGRARIMADIPGYHISPEQAAEAAAAARAKALAFTHIIPSVPPSLEPALLGDAAARYDGPIHIMRDGDLLSIGAKGITRRNLFE